MESIGLYIKGTKPAETVVVEVCAAVTKVSSGALEYQEPGSNSGRAAIF